MGKYCRAGQATDENMAHVHCMLDIKGYHNTLIMCNSYCFSTATIVAGTRLDVALYYIACLVVIKILYKELSKKPEFQENRPSVTAILHVERK